MSMNEMIQFFRQMSGRLGSNIYSGIQGQSNPQHFAFLRQLQKEIKQENSLELSLKDLKVVVFDLETTGFSPEKGDQVISIGAIKMVGDQIEEEKTFYSLVKSTIPLSSEISLLTNIKDDDLLKAPDPFSVLLDFLKFVNSSILVAHYAKHEQLFMQKMMQELIRSKFEHRLVDTSFFIQLVNPLLKSQSLEDICLQCNVEVINRHHALGDAIMTAKIWRNIIQKAESIGLLTLREMYEYISKQR